MNPGAQVPTVRESGQVCTKAGNRASDQAEGTQPTAKTVLFTTLHTVGQE